MRYFRSLLFMIVAEALYAHGAIHDQIHTMDERIARAPKDAALYLRRGRLYMEEDHHLEAQGDFRTALKLDPRLHAIHYFLAGSLLKGGDPLLAEHDVRRFLAALGKEDRGRLTRGYRLLGQSLSAQKRPLEAAEAYQWAVRHASEPDADDYRACAAAYLAVGAAHVPHALRILDEGIARLGPVTTLQETAIDAELKGGNVDGAITRLDTLIAAGQVRPHLLFRKGELLLQAGHPGDAKRSFQAALAALHALPPSRQNTRAMARLAEKIEARLRAP